MCVDEPVKPGIILGNIANHFQAHLAENIRLQTSWMPSSAPSVEVTELHDIPEFLCTTKSWESSRLLPGCLGAHPWLRLPRHRRRPVLRVRWYTTRIAGYCHIDSPSHWYFPKFVAGSDSAHQSSEQMEQPFAATIPCLDSQFTPAFALNCFLNSLIATDVVNGPWSIILDKFQALQTYAWL